jgi:hypothetical protein
MVNTATIILTRSIAVAWSMIALALLQIGYWSIDRSPPFRLESYTSSPTVPGETMLIDGKVWRDSSRDCSVNFSRYLTDSAGYISNISGIQMLTDAAIDERQAETPNAMHVAVPIPNNVVRGPAELTTVAAYSCNPIQQIFPIQVLIRIPVQIL